ncbi:class I SAM-dependent methyltransferase [Flavobacterium orientale]|nr:class I SAM-dependent methyltransferase [Flavobacterium orientale]
MNLKYVTHKREVFFEVATKYINDTTVVLDVGAGKGDFSNFHKSSDFYLLDGNEETVAFLKEKQHKNVYSGMLPQLPFESNFFDVIHCSHVVEHLYPEQFYETLKEMNRCLKAGGVLIISAPLFWDDFYNDLSHIRPYPPVIFKNYLCTNSNGPRTRVVIDSSYEMLEEIYRYKKEKFFADLTINSTSFLSKLVLKILSGFERMGLKFYKKTGYTIVLKKKH